MIAKEYNIALSKNALFVVLCVCLFSVLGGCAHESEFTSFYAPKAVDFSGHWEKNYQASDDLDSKFRLFLFNVQRSVARSSSSQGGAISGGGFGGSRDSILGLAQLTEDITKVALLEIEQGDNSIKIDREDNFALTCDYFEEQFVVTDNPFGSEICGWNGEQLIFQLNMLDGLSIRHQITIGPDQQQLNITTTISSSEVSSPFTISNFYQRYAPPEYDYDCIFTITRNNVCTQSGS